MEASLAVASNEPITLIPFDESFHWERDAKRAYTCVIIPQLELRDGVSFHVTVTIHGTTRRTRTTIAEITDERGRSVARISRRTMAAVVRQLETFFRGQLQRMAESAHMSVPAYCDAVMH